jgi:hypothetical protein
MNIKLIEALDKNASLFHPIVPIGPLTKIATIDLSSNNDKLNEEIVNDIHLFEIFINTSLSEQKADFLIGGYLEHRALYGRSDVFDGDDDFLFLFCVGCCSGI